MFFLSYDNLQKLQNIYFWPHKGYNNSTCQELEGEDGVS